MDEVMNHTHKINLTPEEEILAELQAIYHHLSGPCAVSIILKQSAFISFSRNQIPANKKDLVIKEYQRLHPDAKAPLLFQILGKSTE